MSDMGDADMEADHGLVVEAESGDVKIDIVAVHGIGGDRMTTWSFEDDPGSCWLQESYSQSRVMLYGYDSTVDTGTCFTSQGIIREAKQLLKSLRGLRKDNEVAKRPIMLVSHGIGGLLVKAALVLASRDPSNFEWFIPAVRVLTFFGYPHKPSSLDSLRDGLFPSILQCQTEPSPTRPLFPLVKSLSETIDEVNGLFVQAKVLVQVYVIDFVSTAPEPGFEKSSTLLSVPFGRRVQINRSHATMTRLNRDNVDIFKDMETEDWTVEVLDGAHARTIRGLISQASPIYPATTTLLPPAIPVIDDFLKSELDVVLHLHSDDEVDTSRFLSAYLRDNDYLRVVDFQFDPYDVRFNDLQSMLRTCVCLLQSHRIDAEGPYPIQTLDYIQAMQAWTTGDLIHYWQRSICSPGNDYVHVLGGLDRCDGSGAEIISFLKTLLREDELGSKFIVTTTSKTNQDIRSKMSELQGLGYQSHAMSISSRRGGKEDSAPTGRLAVLLQKYVRNTSGDEVPLDAISALLQAFSDDTALLQIIRKWVTSDCRPPMDPASHPIRSILVDRPTQEHVFDAILSSIPVDRQSLARSVIAWTLLCFRPITTDELRLILHFVWGTAESAQDVLDYFRGLIRIEHGELHFGHPRVRAWLESDTDSESRRWWRLGSRIQEHLAILTTCLNILTATDRPPPMSEWPTVHEFPYAVEYWPSHFKQAQAAGTTAFAPVLTKATRLLEDNSLRCRWMNAYAAVANHFTGPDQESSQALPIAAHFGLDDLIKVFSDKVAEQGPLALIEAARQGHLGTVRGLLPRLAAKFSLDDPKLEKLLRAAASGGSQSVMSEVMKLIPEHNPDPEATRPWLSSMLLVACWNNEELVAKLLDLGADPHAILAKNSRVGAIELAASRNATGVIKVFLERKIDISPSTGIGNRAIATCLGVFGRSQTIRLLLSNGITPGVVNKAGWSPLQCAVFLGRHAAVDTLLEQAPYHDYMHAVEDKWYPLLIAATQKKVRTTEVLLKHNANLSMSDDNGNALYHAITTGNLHICEMLVNKGIDIHFGAGRNLAPLLRSVVTKPKVQIIRLLLKHGADIEVREPEGWHRTPLLMASSLENEAVVDIVRLLLEYHADVTARDSDGWTSLYTAAYFGRVGIVLPLIKAGSDLTAACGTDKQTPLHTAVDSLEVTAILLDQGLDASRKYEAAESPLEAAAGANKPEVVKLIVDRPLENTKALPAALLRAVSSGHEEVVRVLLDAGGDVDHADEKGISLLSYAISRSSESIVSMLLEFCPDLESHDTDGNTVLHHISSSTPVASVRIVANARAKLDVPNNRGNTPLVEAIDYQATWDVVVYLASMTARVHALNIEGRYGTALHMVCRYGTNGDDVELIKLLVENGSHVNHNCGSWIQTPLVQACERHTDNNNVLEKESIIRCLVEELNTVVKAPANTLAPIHVCSMACGSDLVKLFIQRGADATSTDDMRRTAFHFACYNSLAAVEALGLPGKNFATKDIFGRLPLHYAALSGQLDLLEHVLERTEAAGLGVDEQDEDGWTALLWAARATDISVWTRYGEKGDVKATEMVEFLLKRGASRRARGRVPLDVGCDAGEWSAADIARYHGALELAHTLENEELSLEKHAGLRKIGDLDERNACDGCFLLIRGIYYSSKKQDGIAFCFKCHMSRDQVCPGHEFERQGSETVLKESEDAEKSVASEEEPEGISSDPWDDGEVISDDD